MLLDCLEKILRRNSLTVDEAAAVMAEILSGRASPTQAGALLIALSMKGETEEELLGMAGALQDKTYPWNQFATVDVALSNLETRASVIAAGAEGDRATDAEPELNFRVTAAAAFVIAGAGGRVVHQSGYMHDEKISPVLAGLGINRQIPKENIARGISEVGLGFVTDPLAGDAMQHLRTAYREVPVPTALDVLLPICNPGRAPGLVLRADSSAITETVAGVISRMGARRAFIVMGKDGRSENATTGPTVIMEVRDGRIQANRIEPGDVHSPAGSEGDVGGGDGRDLILPVLRGDKGFSRDRVLWYAAPGMILGGQALDFAQGVEVAAHSIDSGAALRVLERLAEFTHSAV